MNDHKTPSNLPDSTPSVSILDKWGVSVSELSELVDGNPSLRGILLGYIAELKFEQMYLHEHGLDSTKDDDHDRTKKGDRRLEYDGHDLIVEVKSLQTKTVKYNSETGVWSGSTQVDGSDRREVLFSDGSFLTTTLLQRGEFDILAVNCFAFGETWKFAFALNEDLEISSHKGYTQAQRSQLIKSMQKVTWPPQPPFTDDFELILKRAWDKKQKRWHSTD